MFSLLTQPDIWTAINLYAFPNMRAATFRNYTETTAALSFRYFSMLKASTHLKYVSLRKVVASEDFDIIDAAIKQRHDDKFDIYTDEEYLCITFYDRNTKSLNDHFIVDTAMLKQVSISTFCYLLENYCDISTLTSNTKKHIVLYVFRANDVTYVERIPGFKQMVLEQPNLHELFEKLMWDVYTDRYRSSVQIRLLRIRNQQNFLPVLKWYYTNFGEDIQKYLKVFVRYGIDYGYIDVLEWLENISNLRDIRLDNVLSLGGVTDARIREFLKKYNYFTEYNIDTIQLPIDILVSQGDIDSIKRIHRDRCMDRCHYTSQSLYSALEKDHHEVVQFLSVEDTGRFNDFLRYYIDVEEYMTKVVYKLIQNRITNEPYLSLSIEEQDRIISDFMISREYKGPGLEYLLLGSVAEADVRVVQYILSHSREIGVEFVNKRFYVEFLSRVIKQMSSMRQKISYSTLIICKQVYHHTKRDMSNTRINDTIFIVDPLTGFENRKIFDLFDRFCRKYVGVYLRIVERK